LLLSWPAAASAGLVLQQSFIPGATNWTAVTQLAADDGTNKTVVVSPANDNRVFRLKWP
jgi:hypothetical protein